jgi:Ca2+-binding EF-hand superfamily protein
VCLTVLAGDRNAWFRKLDRNHDGYLDRKELAGLRRHLAVFDQADENKDGRLDPDEFIKAEILVQEAKRRAANPRG